MRTPDHELAQYVHLQDSPYFLHRADLEAALATNPGARPRIRSIDGWWLDAIMLGCGDLAIPRAMHNADGLYWIITDSPATISGTPQAPSGSTAGAACSTERQLGHLGLA